MAIRSSGPVDVMLSHNWGDDAEGRDNHARVLELNAALEAAGVTTWCDAHDMRATPPGAPGASIDAAMAGGIDRARLVLVCLTRRYIEKVQAAGKDNVKFEFQYACGRKGVDKILVAVMEPGCRDTATWSGPVGLRLNAHLYFDLADTQLSNAGDLADAIKAA